MPVVVVRGMDEWSTTKCITATNSRSSDAFGSFYVGAGHITYCRLHNFVNENDVLANKLNFFLCELT